MSDLPAHVLGEIHDALADIVERLDLLLPPAPNVELTIRLTADAPESLHARIKIAYARNELKMSTLIREGVHRALEHYEREVA